MEYTFDDDTVSDLHKDAYGFRPSQAFFQWWSTATDAEKQVEWDDLVRLMEASVEQERQAQAYAVVVFEKRMAEVIASGAGDRATAVRWMMDAEGGCNGDVSYLEYLCGIPYGHISGKRGY